MSTAIPARTYEGAIDVLNTLQTPFAVIEERRRNGIRPDESSIREMRAYFARLGHTSRDLDRLNIIHVAGTKGKGSTCTFADSILAHHKAAHAVPRRIGLLTSPHLVAVRERIRIDSRPLSEALFAKYFFEVWDRLESGPARDALAGDAAPGSKPIYARYLTLMGLHAFLREGVDCAVLETGVGGEFDATNIVDRPLASGISTLGIDHVFVLGDTVDKIAWHKAGIMKTGSPAFSVEQVPAAEAVLRKRAEEKGVDLRVLKIEPRLGGVKIRPDAAFQKKNASLAIALAETALQKLDPSFVPDPNRLPRDFVDGLEQVVWRGRCEVKEDEHVRWYLDGAHTVDSLRMSAWWFHTECDEHHSGPRVLIFNQQGRAEAVNFLEGLYAATKVNGKHAFGHVIFCTNVTYAETGYRREFVNHQYDEEAIKKLTVQRNFAKKWSSLDPEANVMVMPSIEEAINQARHLAQSVKEGDKLQAFITGSLHLVGGALSILEGVDSHHAL